MPLNKLDETPALIVIDLQKAMLGLPAEPPIQDVVNRTRELARALRERGLPVVLVNASGRAPGRTDAGAPKFRTLRTRLINASSGLGHRPDEACQGHCRDSQRTVRRRWF